jgi:tetratricopeptide (TPR) repeat protein
MRCNTASEDIDFMTQSTDKNDSDCEYPSQIGPYALLELDVETESFTIHKAQHCETHEFVKITLIPFARDDNLCRQRFRNAAEAAAKLQHHAIAGVELLECGEYEAVRLPFGNSLAITLTQRQFTNREAAQLVADIATAAQFACSKGLLHLRINPDNILLVGDKPLLVNFGNHALNDPTMHERDRAFLAPEQTDEGKVVDQKSDVFGLGAVLYRLLTGRPPVVGSASQSYRASPPRPRLLEPHLDPKLEAICLKSIELKVSRRYSSAAAFEEDLGCFLDELPITARPYSLRRRLFDRMQRSPVVTAALIVASIVFVATLVWLAYQNDVLEAALAKEIADGQRSSLMLDAALTECRKHFRASVFDPRQLRFARDPSIATMLRQAQVVCGKRLVFDTNTTIKAEVQSLVHAQWLLGLVAAELGDEEMAIKHLRSALGTLAEFQKANPLNSEHTLAHVRLLWTLGFLCARVDQLADAFEAFKEARARSSQHFAKDRSDRSAQLHAAVANTFLGDSYLARTEAKQAIDHFETANELFETLAANNSNTNAKILDYEISADLCQGINWYLTARAIGSTEGIQQARQPLEESTRILQELVLLHPKNSEFRYQANASRLQWVRWLHLSGRTKESANEAAAVIEECRQLVETRSQTPEYKTQLALAYQLMAQIESELSETIAFDQFELAITIQCQATNELPPDMRHRETLLSILDSFSNVAQARISRIVDNRDAAAPATLERYLSIAEIADTQAADHAKPAMFFGQTLAYCAAAFDQLNLSEKAAKSWGQLRDRLPFKHRAPVDLRYARSLAMSGNVTKAEQVVAARSELLGNKAEQYDAACVWARIAEHGKKNSDAALQLRASTRAVETLKRVPRSFFRDSENKKLLATDPNFAALRGFQLFDDFVKKVQ